MQSASEAMPIRTFGGSFDAPPLASENDLVAGEPERSRTEATAFIAEMALSCGRPPLFRR